MAGEVALLQRASQMKLFPGGTPETLQLVERAHDQLVAAGRRGPVRALAAYRRAHLLYRLDGEGTEKRLQQIDSLLQESTENDTTEFLGPWPQIYRLPALHRLGRGEEAQVVWADAHADLVPWRERITSQLGDSKKKADVRWRARTQDEGFSLLEIVGHLLGFPYQEDLHRGPGRPPRIPEPFTLAGDETWAVLDTTEEDAVRVPRALAVHVFRHRQTQLREEGVEAVVYSLTRGGYSGWLAPLAGPPERVSHSELRFLANVQMGASRTLDHQRRWFEVDDPAGALRTAKSRILGTIRETMHSEDLSPFVQKGKGQVIRVAPGVPLLGLVNLRAAHQGGRLGRPPRDAEPGHFYGWVEPDEPSLVP